MCVGKKINGSIFNNVNISFQVWEGVGQGVHRSQSGSVDPGCDVSTWCCCELLDWWAQAASATLCDHSL